ncbi:hypothetical protein Y032_0656g1208 [Ancylostoma ceylanicum]|nr:hypothetical protein Y032_0656g1208 [Ancylostoma ceylanicum]
MNRLKEEGENAGRTEVVSETRQFIPLEELLAFPFRICSRHFSTKCADSSTPVVPNINLPEKPLFFRENMDEKGTVLFETCAYLRFKNANMSSNSDDCCSLVKINASKHTSFFES